MSDIKSLVEQIVVSLVDDPDSVRVDVSSTDDATVYGIEIAQHDIGKVIGKEGRIANAIRTVVKAAAAQTNHRVNVEILTKDKGDNER